MTDQTATTPDARSGRPRGRQAAFGFIYAASVMNTISFGLMIPVLPGLIRSFYGGANDAATAAAAPGSRSFTTTRPPPAAHLRAIARPIPGTAPSAAASAALMSTLASTGGCARRRECPAVRRA